MNVQADFQETPLANYLNDQINDYNLGRREMRSSQNKAKYAFRIQSLQPRGSLPDQTPAYTNLIDLNSLKNSTLTNQRSSFFLP